MSGNPSRRPRLRADLSFEAVTTREPSALKKAVRDAEAGGRNGGVDAAARYRRPGCTGFPSSDAVTIVSPAGLNCEVHRWIVIRRRRPAHEGCTLSVGIRRRARGGPAMRRIPEAALSMDAVTNSAVRGGTARRAAADVRKGGQLLAGGRPGAREAGVRIGTRTTSAGGSRPR